MRRAQLVPLMKIISDINSVGVTSNTIKEAPILPLAAYEFNEALLIDGIRVSEGGKSDRKTGFYKGVLVGHLNIHQPDKLGYCH